MIHVDTDRSSYFAGFKWTAGGQTITAQPAGMVYPAPLHILVHVKLSACTQILFCDWKYSNIFCSHTLKLDISKGFPEDSWNYICQSSCFIDELRVESINL